MIKDWLSGFARLSLRDIAIITMGVLLTCGIAMNQGRNVPHTLLIPMDHSGSVVERIKHDSTRITGKGAAERTLEEKLLLGIEEAVQPCVKRANVVVVAFGNETDPVHQAVMYDQQPQFTGEVMAAVKPLLETPAAGEGTRFSQMLAGLADRCDAAYARDKRLRVDILLITDGCLDMPRGEGPHALNQEIEATIAQAKRLNACKNLGKILVCPVDDGTARNILANRLFQPLASHLKVTSSKDEMVMAFKNFSKGE